MRLSTSLSSGLASISSCPASEVSICSSASWMKSGTSRTASSAIAFAPTRGPWASSADACYWADKSLRTGNSANYTMRPEPSISHRRPSLSIRRCLRFSRGIFSSNTSAASEVAPLTCSSSSAKPASISLTTWLIRPMIVCRPSSLEMSNSTCHICRRSRLFCETCELVNLLHTAPPSRVIFLEIPICPDCSFPFRHSKTLDSARPCIYLQQLIERIGAVRGAGCDYACLLCL